MGQRVLKHLTCRVVSRRRDLYEIGVSHVLLRFNSPPGSISSDPGASSSARRSPGELLECFPISLHTGRTKIRVAGAHAGVERAVADAFEHPGSLRVSPFGLRAASRPRVVSGTRHPHPTFAAPIWLDESGQPRPTRPCLRYGREAPFYRVRPEHLRILGWPPFRVWSFVGCCGHAQEVIRALEADGRCRLIPVLGWGSNATSGLSPPVGVPAS